MSSLLVIKIFFRETIVSDILGDFSNSEQDLSNLILIGDKQENFDDGQRWTSGIEPTGNNSKLKVEEFNTGGDEPSLTTGTKILGFR